MRGDATSRPGRRGGRDVARCRATLGAARARLRPHPPRPPIHHGKRICSVHVKRVPPALTGSSVNRPVPVNRPRCSIPIARSGSHSVTIMRSVVRSGPILREAVERGADAAVLRARERDRHRVGHPLDMGLDRLDDLPHRARCGASIVTADLDGHDSDAHCAPRGSRPRRLRVRRCTRPDRSRLEAGRSP